MKKSIITVIGGDKPGIIASVSESLFRQGCNIENISQTILQSEFAAIYIVSLPDGISIETLEDSLTRDVSEMGLTVHLKYVDEHSVPGTSPSESEPFIVTTTGPDRKGLVAIISRVFADAGVNITNLKAVFEGGDNPTRNIMLYEIDVPSGIHYQKMSENLKQKAAELNLDLSIQHKNIFDTVNRI